VAKKCKHCGEMLDPSLRQTQEATPQYTNVKYNASTNTFTGTMILMIKLALRVIQELNWKVENVNENLGIIVFETVISWGSWGGIFCTLNVDEISPSTFRVRGTGEQNFRGGHLIVLNIGHEAQKKVQKVIDKMKQLSG
jgi:hypothetical protein